MIAPGPEAMARIGAVALREAGLAIGYRKANMVHARLRVRLRELGNLGYADYCTLLEDRGDRGRSERTHLVEALTTQVGDAFREPHHFDLLVEHVASLRADAPGRRIRLWSAGCAEGAEPISMAAALDAASVCPPDAVAILGTDVSPRAVTRGRARLASGSDRLRASWVERISLEVGNLLEPPPPGPFDAIFCRNVTIYFDPAVASAVQGRLIASLAPDGIYCIGHSERLMPTPTCRHLARIGQTAWRAARPDTPCP